jgi:hypothetical protein
MREASSRSAVTLPCDKQHFRLSKRSASDFHPETFEDDYEQALREIIEKKAKGEKIERPKQPAGSNVVSLMDALRASVDAEGRAGASKSRRTAPSRPTRKASRSHSKQKRLARRPLVVAVAQQDVKRRKGEME